MFAENILYDHKFDIDDIIAALCADDHGTPATGGRWILNTRSKQLIREAADAPTAPQPDGADNNHWHVIEPLPLSFLNEIRTHHTFMHKEKNEQQHIDSILSSVTHMHQLPAHFNTADMAGGWLRERVKDAALEWLDMRGLIPPSMRHVRDSSPFSAPPAPGTKVSIQ